MLGAASSWMVPLKSPSVWATRLGLMRGWNTSKPLWLAAPSTPHLQWLTPLHYSITYFSVVFMTSLLTLPLTPQVSTPFTCLTTFCPPPLTHTSLTFATDSNPSSHMCMPAAIIPSSPKLCADARPSWQGHHLQMSSHSLWIRRIERHVSLHSLTWWPALLCASACWVPCPVISWQISLAWQACATRLSQGHFPPFHWATTEWFLLSPTQTQGKPVLWGQPGNGARKCCQWWSICTFLQLPPVTRQLFPSQPWAFAVWRWVHTH